MLIIKNFNYSNVHEEISTRNNFMGLFWRRKSKDQFVTLGLNEPPVSHSLAEPVTLPSRFGARACDS